MTLGEKISAQRKINGLSQELLAEKCGTSLRTIQRIETNQSQPRPYTLKVIADTLRVKMEDLSPDVNIELQENVSSEAAADNSSISKINLINSSALLGILFPFLNLIVPIILWKLNSQNALVSEKGKMVISFQILWSLATLFTLVIIFYLHFYITGEFMSGRTSFEFIAYLLLLITNVFFIIKNSILLKKGNANIYASFPYLF